MSLHLGPVLAIGLLLLGGGCVQEPTVTAPVGNQPTTVGITPPVKRSEVDINAVVASLRTAFSREVPQHVVRTSQSDLGWITRTKAALAAAAFQIDHAQLLVVVDRAPRAQQLRIILAQPMSLPWYVIGGSKVSTGQAGRHGYFITPTGVFPHTTAILDYRALGTFNQNHIRGLGLKDMRVWDFGWQTADQGWRDDGAQSEIRLLLHATDPDYLEQRLGRSASKGCVRIPATMNRFLDLNGVLDADYEQAAKFDARFAAVLLPERHATSLAGDTLVVIDSSAHP